VFESLASKNLVWLPEKGIGFYPVDSFPYDQEYFDKYKGYAETTMGEKLTAERVAFVGNHYSGELVDVGIGSGHFIQRRGKARGYDVSSVGKKWLRERGLWCDIYRGEKFAALTFWDSLEHIKDIDLAVSKASRYVFLSIPIFDDSEHVLRSKHFRKDEHFWYFTHKGLVAWFLERGFIMIDCVYFEQALGREDITTYAFWRQHA
jgi:hypothetical protein